MVGRVGGGGPCGVQPFGKLIVKPGVVCRFCRRLTILSEGSCVGVCTISFVLFYKTSAMIRFPLLGICLRIRRVRSLAVLPAWRIRGTHSDTMPSSRRFLPTGLVMRICGPKM